MRIKLQLVICSDDGQEETVTDVITLKAFPKNWRNKWRYPVHFTGQGVHVRDSEVQSA